MFEICSKTNLLSRLQHFVPPDAEGYGFTVYDARELDDLEFFHIKLERHKVIYAEGNPCETVMNVAESAVDSSESIYHHGSPTTHEAPCARLLSLNGGRSEIRSRFRSAISPRIDRRQKLDIIRDEIEERGIALLREAELISRGRGVPA
jgi:hypothetical protein